MLRWRGWWRGSALLKTTSKPPAASPWRVICIYRRNVRDSALKPAFNLSLTLWEKTAAHQDGSITETFSVCVIQVRWGVCGPDTTALMRRAQRCSPWATQRPDQPADRWTQWFSTRSSCQQTSSTTNGDLKSFSMNRTAWWTAARRCSGCARVSEEKQTPSTNASALTSRWWRGERGLYLGCCRDDDERLFWD